MVDKQKSRHRIGIDGGLNMWYLGNYNKPHRAFRVSPCLPAKVTPLSTKIAIGKLTEDEHMGEFLDKLRFKFQTV